MQELQAVVAAKSPSRILPCHFCYEEMQAPCHALSATEREQSHLLSPHPVFFDVFPQSPVTLTLLEREAVLL